MNSQVTIRLNDTTNQKAIAQAEVEGVTRATLIRNSLNSYLSKKNPNGNSEVVNLLKQQLEIANDRIESAEEKSKRSDIITMELTQQIKSQQKQLQDLTAPRTLWQKLFTVFN